MFFFQAEDGIRDLVRSRGLGDVYKRQIIKFQVPVKTNVTLKIFDLLGREVTTLIDETKNAGFYEAIFDGSKLASGVYLYSIQTENYTNTKKLILIK